MTWWQAVLIGAAVSYTLGPSWRLVRMVIAERRDKNEGEAP